MKLTKMLKRRTSVSVALVVLLAYVALSGFNPSIIRAAIMATIAIVAQLLGRQRLAIQLLYLTSIIMLMVNPLWLVDTSFQLSFAATLAIITIEPVIHSRLSRLPSWLEEVISTTLAAQIGTLPIIAATFGTVALFGLGANLLVLWLVPWVMLVGAFSIAALLVAPWLQLIISWLIEPGLWYIKQTIIVAANTPMASLNFQASLYLCILYYLVTSLAVWRLTPHETA